ncbi:class I SAM-dependent methyltransferase [Frigidibacter sp. MR17.14]|uniref:class I SAM-dependent methyltransferase n=1 Tax=Frigidibacter sp. MR17.14 TaxID=3126509 RepID=UPI003012A72B
MSDSRLTTALDGGDALPPEGTILVLGATAASDLSALPQARTHLVQGMFPDHKALTARGWTVTPEPAGEDHAAALVLIPRARAAAERMLAEAMARCRPGAPIWVDGQKTDGIEALQRALAGRLPVGAVTSKAHGRSLQIAADPAACADWMHGPAEAAPGFVTRPGVFSADGIDPGSALLAGVLPALSGKVGDLGAGWGWLAAQVLARSPKVKRIDLVEADHAALACAQANVTDPRARFHWADATDWRADGALDAVVMNPPFHAGGRSAEPELGLAFIRAAARVLLTSGELWIVANRQLPYEPALAAAFAEVQVVGGDGRFKLIRAARPLKGKAAVAAPDRGKPATGTGPRARGGRGPR